MRLCELSPSSREQTLNAIIEARGVWEVCCALSLETEQISGLLCEEVSLRC